jgi:hypothetical protein
MRSQRVHRHVGKLEEQRGDVLVLHWIRTVLVFLNQLKHVFHSLLTSGCLRGEFLIT